MNYHTAFTATLVRSASRLAPALLLSVTLGACSGGGGGVNKSGSASEIVSPRGVYTGFFTSNVTNRTEEVTGVISASGQGHLRSVESGEQITMQLGQPQPGSNDAAGTITLYQPGDPSSFGTQRSTGSVEATIRTQDSISGTYATNSGEGGTFSLNYDATASELGSRLSNLAGVWSAESTSERYTMNLTVQPDGSFNGSDSKHCIYTGKFEVPDFRFNGYRVSASVQCDATARSTTGLATLQPAQGTVPNRTPEKLSFGISNGDRAFHFELTKQSSPPTPSQ